MPEVKKVGLAFLVPNLGKFSLFGGPFPDLDNFFNFLNFLAYSILPANLSILSLLWFYLEAGPPLLFLLEADI